ncbi:hypothetical protein PT2222_180201 [Paraburkholderia tropica]
MFSDLEYDFWVLVETDPKTVLKSAYSAMYVFHIRHFY